MISMPPALELVAERVGAGEVFGLRASVRSAMLRLDPGGVDVARGAAARAMRGEPRRGIGLEQAQLGGGDRRDRCAAARACGA